MYSSWCSCFLIRTSSCHGPTTDDNIVTWRLPSAKGSADHVPHFSEAHHNWTQQGRTPRSPFFDHHPTPTDTSSAHPPSRCVPTTTPSAARRSTPARCVLKFTPPRRMGGKRTGIVRIQRLRHCDLTTHQPLRPMPADSLTLAARTIFNSGLFRFANTVCLLVIG